MAGVSTPEMLAAVNHAGGLGGLAIGHLSCDQAALALTAVQALTDRPFNVNLFCHKKPERNPANEKAWLEHLVPSFHTFHSLPPSELSEPYQSFLDAPDILSLLLHHKPAVVSFHFGLASESAVRALKGAGITLLASVTSLAEGRAAEAAGIDVVVAQGYEAGGHRGVFDPQAGDDQLSTSALTRHLVTHLRCPVIAAGGVMDSPGVKAALALGAVAVQMGTAFLATPESAASDAHKNALLLGPGDTMMTSAISGRPARCLRNLFTNLPLGPKVPDYPVAYSAGKALHQTALKQGEHGFGAHWAGCGAPLAKSLSSFDIVANISCGL